MRKGILRKFLCLILCTAMMLGIFGMNETFVVKVMAETTYNIDSDKLPYTQEEIFEQLFDINNKISIDVSMSKAELKKLNDDYVKYENMGSKSPIYRKADVQITIKTTKDTNTYVINEVGVRLKGNTSRSEFYDTSRGIYNLVHLKLDFQETFDDEAYYGSDVKVWGSDDVSKALRKARKNRTFATLEKLDMKWNRNIDNTYIREYYAYETFRNNGVLAPHTNLSSVDWSDNHMGVYTIYEPIDKVFIDKNMPQADQGGDLYKCGWADGGADMASVKSYGIEDEDKCEFYCYDLKTNKKTSDHSSLVNFLKAMNGGNLTKSIVEKYLDVDSFMKFAAVSYFTGNPDDFRNNYNNYYIYFKKSDNKMIFIPYDFDRCLGITNGLDKNNGMTDSNPYSSQAATAGGQQNPVITNTICQGGLYIKEYTEALKNVAKSTWLTTDKFTSVYNIAKNNYSSDVTPSKDFNNAKKSEFKFDIANSGKNMTFSKYITGIKSMYTKCVNNSESYTHPAFYIRGNMNDWQLKDSYKMSYDSKSNLYKCYFKTTSQVSFKINNGVDGDAGAWYGFDYVVSKPSTMKLTTDSYNNINGPAGAYTVYFDLDNKKIVIGSKKQTISGTTSYVKYSNAKAFKLDSKSNAKTKLSYSSSNKNVATVSSSGVVTIKGAGVATINAKAPASGYYAATSKKVKIIVKPKTQSATIKSTSKGKALVKWNKDSKAQGYQVVYSTTKSFSKYNRVNVSRSKYSVTLTKLKSKKNCYVKVRAYVTDGSKKYYGKYSAIKKVMVK